jgi:hypothetical protein
MVSDPVAATDWRQQAAAAHIPEGIIIGGERRATIDGSTRTVTSTRDGSALVELAWVQPADAAAARRSSAPLNEEYTYLKSTWIRYA